MLQAGTTRGRRTRRAARGARPRSAVLLLLIALLAGCTNAPAQSAAPDPQPQLDRFITLMQSSDFDSAAAMTSSPGAAAQTIASVRQDLGAKDLSLAAGGWNRKDERTASVPVDYRWQLPGAGIWTYQANWTWHLVGNGEKARWVLDWEPTVLHPQLGARQTLAVRTSDADAGVLVDRNNRPLLTPATVFSVQADPRKVGDRASFAKTLVGLLKGFDSSLDPDKIIEGLKKADPTIGYTVINLREAEFKQVQERLAAVPGLSFPSQVRNLGPTKDFARALLLQVEPVLDGLSQGSKGWKIVSVDATGAEVETLAEQAPTAGAKVMLTLDTASQIAAEKALVGIKEQAVLVAIQPSTGEILAVAQNAAANAEGPIALVGRYPPGSTFKIVTATAAIDRKLITPTKPVPCPGEWKIRNRPIRNNDSFDLGTVPATLAFAKSCNTTFAQLAVDMPPDALTKDAAQYGIGLDFVIPGITTLTGQAPASEIAVQRAENGFGQGKTLVTPFSAALMAATAATTNMPVPTLIRGKKTTQDKPAPPRSAAAKAAIETFMRAVVTEGSARDLKAQDLPGATVHAKTGTAEFTNAKGEIHAHAWTVGYRGDIAFSVLIVGGDSSRRTNHVVAKFLNGLPKS